MAACLEGHYTDWAIKYLCKEKMIVMRKALKAVTMMIQVWEQDARKLLHDRITL